jgi:hypothetical protein
MPPSQDVTVTPQASNLIFVPPSITFFASRGATNGAFNVTATSPQIVTITYALSGIGSGNIGLPTPSNTLIVNYGTGLFFFFFFFFFCCVLLYFFVF